MISTPKVYLYVHPIDEIKINIENAKNWMTIRQRNQHNFLRNELHK